MKRTPLARRTPIRTKHRPTGFTPTQAATIKARDNHTCVVAVACDGTPGTAQTINHIINRGTGGTRDPATNTVTNGIAVCRLDNGWLEDNPTTAYANGWKQRHGNTGPVRYPDGHWWALHPDGTRRLVMASSPPGFGHGGRG